jgi:hypothetical protein
MPFDATPAETPNKTATLLRSAVQVLIRYGWRQKAYGDVQNGFCLLGAINFAATGFGLAPGDHQGYHDAERTVWHVYRCLGKLPNRSYSLHERLGKWNDDQRRTKADVIDLLEKAADAV